jgi:hypothetical protein
VIEDFIGYQAPYSETGDRDKRAMSGAMPNQAREKMSDMMGRNR